MTSNHKSRNIILAILVALILFSIYFFSGTGLWVIVQKPFTALLRISNNVTGSFSLGTSFFTSEATLIKENQELKNEIVSLNAELLARSMNWQGGFFNAPRSEDFITVYPLSFAPRTPYDTILIDKGKNDGVVVGARVFFEPSVEVGKIDLVSGDTARVRLFSSSLSRTEVAIARTGEVVELPGNGSGNFKIELPLSFDIQENDTFVSLGEAHSIIAKVGFIKKDEGKSLLTIFAALPEPIMGNSHLYVTK